MSFNTLKPEIWSHILSFLAPQQPKPLSGLTKDEYAHLDDGHDTHIKFIQSLPDSTAPGVTLRKDIRAPALAALMRTSIAFNHLASYHLYRNVIIDDLRRFTQELSHPPAHPQLESKAELLKHIRSMSLEYRRKGDDPDYISILEDKQNWLLLGSGRPMTTTLNHALDQAVNEAFDISASLTLLQGGNPKRTMSRFPRLTRLAIGSIFGGFDTLWGGVAQVGESFVLTLPNGVTGKLGELIEMSRQATVRVFRMAPIEHYCQRSFSGPFSPPATFDWAQKAGAQPAPTIPLFTMHLNPISDVRAVNTGQRTRWLIENGMRTEGTTNQLCLSISVRLYKYYYALLKSQQRLDLDIEIYASSNRHSEIVPSLLSQPTTVSFCRPEEERDILREIVRADDEERQKLGVKKLRVISSWKTAPESPPCKACGWVFEEEGRWGR